MVYHMVFEFEGGPINEQKQIFAKDVRNKSNVLYGPKTYKACKSFSARIRRKLKLKSTIQNEGTNEPIWKQI